MHKPFVYDLPFNSTIIFIILDTNYFPDHNSFGLLIQGVNNLIFFYLLVETKLKIPAYNNS